MLDRGQPIVNPAFFRRRIEHAEARRKRVVANSDCYRLVHAEGDLLPGLIVDRYAGALAVQTLTQGMAAIEASVVSILADLFTPRAIVLRNDAPVRKKEGLPNEIRLAHGELSGLVPLKMNGLNWHADLLGGQKTGIFLDQRENYLAARRWARGQALDCFTSTGGFALHMASACDHVEAADSSSQVLATAKLNRDANQIANVEFREADVFELLAGFNAARRRFDAVVLDPPAFAKSRSAVESALEAYREINLRALRLLDPGGVLVTCSCSHHVREDAFIKALLQAAQQANRALRLLERRSQPPDHPVLLAVPETQYLKCLVVEVV
jgi:23S rRNA (cytosine1962-C5)-methyltransferase